MCYATLRYAMPAIPALFMRCLHENESKNEMAREQERVRAPVNTYLPTYIRIRIAAAEWD